MAVTAHLSAVFLKVVHCHLNSWGCVGIGLATFDVADGYSICSTICSVTPRAFL